MSVLFWIAISILVFFAVLWIITLRKKEGFIEFNKMQTIKGELSVKSGSAVKFIKLYDNLYFHAPSRILLEIDGIREVAPTDAASCANATELIRATTTNNITTYTFSDSAKIDKVHVKQPFTEVKTYCGSGCTGVIADIANIGATASSESDEWEHYVSQCTNTDKYLVFMFHEAAHTIVHVVLIKPRDSNHMTILGTHLFSTNSPISYIPDSVKNPECNLPTTNSSEPFVGHYLTHSLPMAPMPELITTLLGGKGAPMKDPFTSQTNITNIANLGDKYPRSLVKIGPSSDKGYGFDATQHVLVVFNGSNESINTKLSRYGETQSGDTKSSASFPGALSTVIGQSSVYSWVNKNTSSGYECHVIVTTDKTYVIALNKTNPETPNHVYKFSFSSSSSATTDSSSTNTGTNTNDAQDKMDKSEYIGPPLPEIIAAVKDTPVTAIKDTTVSAVNATGSAVETTATAAAVVGATTAVVAGNVGVQAIQSAETALTEISKTTGNAVEKTVDTAGNTIMKTVDTAGNTIVKTVDTAGNTITETVDTAGNTISKTVDTAGSVISGTSDNIAGVANHAIRAIESMVNMTVGSFFGAINQVTGGFFQLLDPDVKSGKNVGNGGNKSLSSLLPQETNPTDRMSASAKHPYIVYPDKKPFQVKPMPASYAAFSL